MKSKQATAEIVRRLKIEYPDSDCTLIFEDAFALLCSVRLAAQCTDARVNVVMPAFLKRFPNAAALANADVAEVTALVRTCGLGNTKARDLVAMAQMLTREFGGVVPSDMDELLRLPGVGRKSANLIRGDVFGLPAVVTDTHCIRLANRIGFIKNDKNPLHVERALLKVLPPEESNGFCHRCVDHGRAVCHARKPLCHQCVLRDLCDFKEEL